jgi:hypothetical protein
MNNFLSEYAGHFNAWISEVEGQRSRQRLARALALGHLPLPAWQNARAMEKPMPQQILLKIGSEGGCVHSLGSLGSDL